MAMPLGRTDQQHGDDERRQEAGDEEWHGGQFTVVRTLQSASVDPFDGATREGRSGQVRCLSVRLGVGLGLDEEIRADVSPLFDQLDGQSPNAIAMEEGEQRIEAVSVHLH